MKHVFKELRKCQNYPNIERLGLKFYPEVWIKDSNNNGGFLNVYNVLGTIQSALCVLTHLFLYT